MRGEKGEACSPEDGHGVEAEVQPVVQHDDVVVVLRQTLQGLRHGQRRHAEAGPCVEGAGVGGEQHGAVQPGYLSSHTHTHTHTHARSHARTHARTHTCTRARAHTHTHTHTHARARTHIHTDRQRENCLCIYTERERGEEQTERQRQRQRDRGRPRDRETETDRQTFTLINLPTVSPALGTLAVNCDSFPLPSITRLPPVQSYLQKYRGVPMRVRCVRAKNGRQHHKHHPHVGIALQQ